LHGGGRPPKTMLRATAGCPGGRKGCMIQESDGTINEERRKSFELGDYSDVLMNGGIVVSVESGRKPKTEAVPVSTAPRGVVDKKNR